MAVQLFETNTGSNHLPERIERKFYLPPQRIGLAYGLLKHVCCFDAEYPSEQINSLYFDTGDLDQYERSSSGEFRKNKIRIRWYGEEKNLRDVLVVFLELKSRQGFASTKQRLEKQVPVEKLTLDNLGKGIIPKTLLVDTLASFGYFPSEPLQPIIKISYWRYRFKEIMTGQRVALDCHICSTMIAREIGNGERDLKLPGGVIEIKGKSMELPTTLKHMKILDLDWSRFSKYSSCIDLHSDEPGTVGRLSPSGKIIQL
jgi:hypothetical protein